MKRIKSPCCDATIGASLADGVLAGYCHKCNKAVVRVNPETGKREWLDGKQPWTHEELRPVDEE